jgi:hypothetical protein
MALFLFLGYSFLSFCYIIAPLMKTVWMEISALLMLAALSAGCVYGAFLGSDGAWIFFHSKPMLIGAAALIGLLVGGVFACFLRSRPMLFLIYLGGLFVICGGFWDAGMSEGGVQAVFAGYILLTIGLLGHFGWKIKSIKAPFDSAQDWKGKSE